MHIFKLNRALALIILVSLNADILFASHTLAPFSEQNTSQLNEALQGRGISRRNFLKTALLTITASSLLTSNKAFARQNGYLITLSVTQHDNRNASRKAIETVLAVTDKDSSDEFKDKLRYILYATPAHESMDFAHRRQLRGPARSLWQIEPETARDFILRAMPRMKIPLADKKETETIETTYTVKSGDAFFKILQNHGIPLVRWQEIAALNKLPETPEGLRRELKPGMKLTLPIESEITAVKTPAITEYTIQPGDSLSRIASKKLGSTRYVGEIKRLNNLKSDNIAAGQKLKIPEVAKEEYLDLQLELAKICGLTKEKLLAKCANNAELEKLLLTNDSFSCFIARVIYMERADKRIRELPGRRTISRQFESKNGRKPAESEIEEIFAKNCALIWQEEYNRSRKDRQGKINQFVMHTKTDGNKEYLTAHIPLLVSWRSGSYAVVNDKVTVIPDIPYVKIGVLISGSYIIYLLRNIRVEENVNIAAEKSRTKAKPRKLSRRSLFGLSSL